MKHTMCSKFYLLALAAAAAATAVSKILFKDENLSVVPNIFPCQGAVSFFWGGPCSDV